MSKISELSDGGSLQSTDYLIAVRSGGNVKVQADGNLSLGALTLTALTVDGTATLGAASTDVFFADNFNSAVRTPASAGHIYLQTYNGAKNLAQFEDNNDVSFYEDTGTTPKFFWDASAEALSVGRSTPVTKLHVAKGELGSDYILRADDNFVSIDANSGGTAAAPALIINGDANTGFWRPASDTLAVSTNGAERMRIDSSGNLLVGTTSTLGGRHFTIGNATAPAQSFQQNGTEKFLFGISGTTNGGVTGSASGDFFARTTGGKMLFSTNDGVTAHAILDASGNLTVAGTLNGISTAKSASGNRWGILPEVEGNGVMEIGRYLDFHVTDGDTSDYGARLDFDGTNLICTAPISAPGGVYLGGTGAANLLDDYEEGTWTPTCVCAGQTITTTQAIGKYTKIGRIVHAECAIIINTVSGTASGATNITGLPFSNNGDSYSGIGALNYNDGFANTLYASWISGTTAFMRSGTRSQSNDGGGFSAGGYINIRWTYITNA